MIENKACDMPNLLVLEGIYKKYYDSVALSDISLNVAQGEICAVVGENGAGKTSLMNIIAGIIKPDAGEMRFKSETVCYQDAKIAFDKGIGIIPQQPQVVDSLTVIQSMFLGHELTKRWSPFLDKAEQEKRGEAVLQSMDWDVHPLKRVGELSFFEKKLLMLARCLLFKCSLLIFDDITANCTPEQADYALELIKRINATGTTVLVITHKVEEVLAIAGHAVVLREGSLIADIRPIDRLSAERLITFMVGDDARNRYPRTQAQRGKTLLMAKNIASADDCVGDMSMTVRSGEVVGIVSLQYATQKALVRLLTLEEQPASGNLKVMGGSYAISGNGGARHASIAYLSSEIAENLFPDRDAKFNVSVGSLDSISRVGFVTPGGINRYAGEYLSMIRLPDGDPDKPVRMLSYGTQQKLALLRIICADNSLIIIENPTSGVDSVSKVELYNIINLLTHRGRGIVLLSNDMQEMIGMCDRIYVLNRNRLAARFVKGQATAGMLLDAAVTQN